MAKRPSVTKAESDAFSEKPKSIRLELDGLSHRLLRVLSAKRGLSMAAFARELVMQAIHEEYPAGDGRLN